jgi:hypothetical protein
MSKDATTDESFGPKLFSSEEPDHTWDLERLGAFARAKQEAILRGERSVPPLYWSLGMTLEIARKQIGRGAWGRQLEEWGFSKAMACRARAIFWTFSSPEALAELTVEQAFSQRQRRQVHARRAKRNDGAGDQPAGEIEDQPGREDGADGLANFLCEIRARADQLIDAAGFMEREKRTALFPAYRAALERLQFLGRVLGAEDEQHAGSEPPASPEPKAPVESHGLTGQQSTPRDSAKASTTDLGAQAGNGQAKE